LSRFHFPGEPVTDGVVMVRRVRDADVEQIVEACRDPEIKRFTSSIPDPYHAADARHWIATHERSLDREVPLAIVDADDPDTLLGMSGLHDAAWPHRRADTGYWIAPAARRRGYASRALALVTEWAFGEFALERIGLYADVENLPSHRVAERVGFAREGVLSRFLVLRGTPRDCVVYGRTA
jgi:RimJ/RimL family protein N-acetyltransferase